MGGWREEERARGRKEGREEEREAREREKQQESKNLELFIGSGGPRCKLTLC